MNAKHTPLPWTFDETWSLIMSGDIEVAALHTGEAMNVKRVNRHVALDNAALIVRAVNAHDVLVKALEPIASWNLKSEMSGIGKDHTDKDALLDTAIRLARTALKLAKEGE